jgi:hypothetical protein
VTKEQKRQYNKTYTDNPVNREKKREYDRAWHVANPKDKAEKSAYDAVHYKMHYVDTKKGRYATLEGRAHQMWLCAKDRAKRQGVPFNITTADVLELIRKCEGVCPVLGIPFEIGIDRPMPGSMTLDKFIPSLGYVLGNVQVISFKANAIKTSATTEEVGKVYHWMCETEKAPAS